VSKGANVNVGGADGSMALTVALKPNKSSVKLQAKNTQWADFLAKHDLDLSQKDDQDISPLEYVKQNPDLVDQAIWARLTHKK
ncbi:hypothetical protein AAEH85_22130, partial [Shewanella algae]|uniref:hypothetical protein n=1 Tax=Shewanella algae TaxID=38313 RepID=UPI00313EB8B1